MTKPLSRAERDALRQQRLERMLANEVWYKEPKVPAARVAEILRGGRHPAARCGGQLGPEYREYRFPDGTPFGISRRLSDVMAERVYQSSLQWWRQWTSRAASV